MSAPEAAPDPQWHRFVGGAAQCAFCEKPMTAGDWVRMPAPKVLVCSLYCEKQLKRLRKL